MSRAYLRIDPQAYERKVIEQGYSLALFGAFMGLLVEAEHQPERGRFRDVPLLKAILGPGGVHVKELIARGDIVVLPTGRLYVDGWDEWQEGDWKVAERVGRIRGRKQDVTVDVTPDVTVPTVPPLGDALSERSGAVSGSGAERDERADLDAFLEVRFRIPTPAQRTFMDGYCQTFDATGPERAARLILSHPDDPIGALKEDLAAFRTRRKAEAQAQEAPKPKPRRSGLSPESQRIARLMREADEEREQERLERIVIGASPEETLAQLEARPDFAAIIGTPDGQALMEALKASDRRKERIS